MPESDNSLRAVAEAALIRARSRSRSRSRARARARATLDREIADHPAPAAGRDAQFNPPRAERRRLSAALHALAQEVFVPTPRWPGAAEARA